LNSLKCCSAQTLDRDSHVNLLPFVFQYADQKILDPNPIAKWLITSQSLLQEHVGLPHDRDHTLKMLKYLNVEQEYRLAVTLHGSANTRRPFPQNCIISPYFRPRTRDCGICRRPRAHSIASETQNNLDKVICRICRSRLNRVQCDLLCFQFRWKIPCPN